MRDLLMKWIRIKFVILSLGLRIDAVQVFSCFNVLEIPFCVKWKTTWMFPEEGFFRENLSITCLWLNFCQYSPFQSSLRKPEGSNISAVGREGHITRRDHSCCVVRTSFGCVQTGAFHPAPPISRIPCAHQGDGTTSLSPLPWAPSSVLATLVLLTDTICLSTLSFHCTDIWDSKLFNLLSTESSLKKKKKKLRGKKKVKK